MNKPAGDNLAVVARGVTRHFERGRVHAVNGADFEVGQGEFVAICGPSACGKTTLLNLLAAVDRPDTGELLVADYSVTAMSEAEANEFRRKVIGLVFQLHNLLPDLTALENVQVPMLGTERSPRRRLERALELLEQVDLGDRAHALPTVLSGGERQRVAVARSLANEPRVLLADEPTGSLDSKNGERLLDLLEKMQRESNTTLIVVTHDTQVSERAGRVLHMLDGRIVSEDG